MTEQCFDKVSGTLVSYSGTPTLGVFTAMWRQSELFCYFYYANVHTSLMDETSSADSEDTIVLAVYHQRYG